jgi:hypothetical protein
MALEDHDPGHTHTLDLTSGDIPASIDGGDFQEEVEERLDRDPDNCLAVEPMGSSEAFRIMEDLTAGLTDRKAAGSLSKALSRRHPFRGFTDALLEYLAIGKQWFENPEKKLLEHAREWLQYPGIEADLDAAPRPAP